MCRNIHTGSVKAVKPAESTASKTPCFAMLVLPSTMKFNIQSPHILRLLKGAFQMLSILLHNFLYLKQSKSHTT